jgi:hypothetical protein
MGIKGGKRPGAGRKKGVPNKATQKRKEVAAKALDGGITPLDYMLTQMRAPIPADAEQAVKVAMMGLRFEAAKAAAPYVHPKLAAIEHRGKDGKDLFGSISVKIVGVRARA